MIFIIQEILELFWKNNLYPQVTRVIRSRKGVMVDEEKNQVCHMGSIMDYVQK